MDIVAISKEHIMEQGKEVDNVEKDEFDDLRVVYHFEDHATHKPDYSSKIIR